MDLVLASQSPRRRELLRLAGFTFQVRSRQVQEVRDPSEAPRDYVIRLAREKAEAAWEGGDEIVLGADTTVVVGEAVAGEQVLEKPADAAQAKEMLQALSGRSHTVLTGICLRHPTGAITDIESTQVYFAQLDPAEIDAYVSTGDSLDKAGAYGIQGLASKFIERVEGCYFNVMGLPLARFYRHWKTLQSDA